MGLPIVIDTWWEPSEAQVRAAKAAGYIGWSGYLSNGNDRVYHGWADATFRMILANGMVSYGYCSGLAPAGQMAARARSLGIEALLDCEQSIRPDGSWVDGWLAASPGVGLYGADTVMNAHASHGHAGYQLGGYPGGDPGVAWPAQNVRPNGPMAWQFTDRITIPGVGVVDGSHFGVGWNQTVGPAAVTTTGADDLPLYLFFARDNAAGGVNAAFIGDGLRVRWIRDAAQLADVKYNLLLVAHGDATHPAADPGAYGSPVDAETAAALGVPFPAGGTTNVTSAGLTADQAAELTALVGSVQRIETALKQA